MELHTVSPAAGYTQADVTNFAKVLTGWSIDLTLRPARLPLPPVHARAGRARSSWATASRPARKVASPLLRFLANHPATHRFLATQAGAAFRRRRPAAGCGAPYRGRAARHRRQSWRRGRIADHAGRRLAAGRASCATRRITSSPACARWTCRRTNRPASTCRASWAASASRSGTRRSRTAGRDRASDWAAPEAMMRRIDWAYGVAGRVGGRKTAAMPRSSPTRRSGRC